MANPQENRKELIEQANKLDARGCYEEADLIDSFLQSEFQNPTEHFLEGNCLVCANSLSGEITKCPTCETAHHADCWQYNQGCAIFGCVKTDQPANKKLLGLVEYSLIENDRDVQKLFQDVILHARRNDTTYSRLADYTYNMIQFATCKRSVIAVILLVSVIDFTALTWLVHLIFRRILN